MAIEKAKKEQMVHLTAKVPASVKREIEEQAKEIRMSKGDMTTAHSLHANALCEKFKPRDEFLNGE